MTGKTVTLLPGQVLNVTVTPGGSVAPPISLLPGDTLLVTVPGVTPPPVGPVDYTIPPSLWTFGAKGSAGGNYRLEINPTKVKIRVAFTTDSVINSFGRNNGANVNLQVSSGQGTSHTMTCEGKVMTSQSPSMSFATAPNAVAGRVTLQAFTKYVIEIDTPNVAAGTYHLNFQNAPY